MFGIGKCRRCEAALAAKDQTIEILRELLRQREESYLALVDIRAHASQYRKPQQPRDAAQPVGQEQSESVEEAVFGSTPAGVRRKVYQPAMTSEQIERAMRDQEGPQQ